MHADAALLDDLTQIAGRLGRVYGALAEQTQDRREGLRWYEAFDRCFFAYRVGLALKLRLARMVHAQPTVPAAEREAERDERPEAERPERSEGVERLEYTERDRDTERASFPLLLKTLNGLVTDAEKLPGPPPAELLTLRELLAQVSPPSCGERPGVGVLARPAKVSPAKAQLLTSTLTPPLHVLPASGRGSVGPPRRATGPPRR